MLYQCNLLQSHATPDSRPQNRKIVTGGTRSVKLWSFDEADPSSDSMVYGNFEFLGGFFGGLWTMSCVVLSSMPPPHTCLVLPRRVMSHVCEG